MPEQVSVRSFLELRVFWVPVVALSVWVVIADSSASAFLLVVQVSSETAFFPPVVSFALTVIDWPLLAHVALVAVSSVPEWFASVTVV